MLELARREEKKIDDIDARKMVYLGYAADRLSLGQTSCIHILGYLLIKVKGATFYDTGK